MNDVAAKPYSAADLDTIHDYPKLTTDVHRWLATVRQLEDQIVNQEAHWQGIVDDMLDEISRLREAAGHTV
jgi:hypothetical protein